MLKGLRVNSAFKSVTHNQDGQLDYVLMKDGINAAKYVAGSFKNLYSDHKSVFLRISTDVDDVVTTSSRVIDADTHTIEDNTSSKFYFFKYQHQQLYQILQTSYALTITLETTTAG